ncbi:Cytochrome P450 [Penicillium roqueforti FM164]|uniref:Cytochrome P450 n=1 Tax=Penicillium roqueforti (strain FM164) TaxID=1365484 RepID=W6QQ17_PENRF|nr:Cytochrome P450 [Penicillium roqueforti FM164]
MSATRDVFGKLWLSSKAVYNIWFHPLRNFPGPWYTKVSRIWYVLRVLQGCHKYEIKRLHDEYGLVVRIVPDELSYIDPRAWNGIYGSVVYNHGLYPMEKDGDFFATAFGDSETLVGAKSAEYKV